MSRRVSVFLLFTAAYFISYFYRSANAVIAGDLAREMALNAGQLGLMTSLFYAAFAAMQIPLGIGLDRWGSRWVTPLLMFVGVVGSLLFAFAPGFGLLGAGRALIGVGMAGVLMGSFKIFSRWFPAHHYATVSGLLVGIGSLGALAAATPLAWLNAAYGWRSVFVIGALITAAVATAIMLFSRNTPPDMPWEGRQNSAGNLRTIFTDARIWRVIPLTFCLAGVLLAFQGLWAGPYLFDVHGLSAVQTGNLLLWLGVGATIGYTASGWICDQFGLRRMTLVAASVFALCQIGLAIQPPLAGVAALLFVLGFSGGFNVMLLALGRQLFPLNMTGQATTAINLFAIGGTFAIQWIMGVIIGRWPVDSVGHYPPAAHSAALLVTGCATALAVLWYAPLVRQE